MTGMLDVQKKLDVSRETMQRLELLAELLKKWNTKINLVSPGTILDLWSRHILDSAQLFDLAGEGGGTWLDMGSGGGFPGLVLAILNAEKGMPWDITMMESDVRKCTFLRTVLREAQVPGTVITQRIEKAEPAQADVVSARALADLPLLLSFSERHLKPEGTALFPKGVTWKKEVQAAEKSWSFSSQVINSATQEGAVILRIKGIMRV